MTMDPALQRVDAIQPPPESSASIDQAGSQQPAEARNEEAKTVAAGGMYEPDEQSVKRSYPDEASASSQKKIKADSDDPAAKDGLAKVQDASVAAESQNIPNDFYSNGMHMQYPPQGYHQQYPQTYHHHPEQFAGQYVHQHQYSSQQPPQTGQQHYDRQPMPPHQHQQQQQHYSGHQLHPQQQLHQQTHPQSHQQQLHPQPLQQTHPPLHPQHSYPPPSQQYPPQNQYPPYPGHPHNIGQEYLHPQQSQQPPPTQQQPPPQMQQYHPTENQQPYQLPQYSGITVTRTDKTDKHDVKAKLKDMGEISVETVKKTEKKNQKDNETGEPTTTTKKTEEDSSTIVERKGNMRKNIREVMDETKLDESTLAAQRQEMERLRRVQEQQRQIRDMQRQANQDRVMSLLQGNDFPLDAQEGTSSTKIGSSVLVRLPNGQIKPTKFIRKTDPLQMSKSQMTVDIGPSSLLSQTNITPSVSIAPIQKRFIEPELLETSDEEEEEERDPLALTPTPPKSDEPVDVIDLSSDSDDDCIVVSETENDPEEDEDPTNSGMHTNDEFNQPNEDGKVVINVGHADDEPDVFVAPQIARIIKPHQIGGIRFLYDNIIESTKMYDTSTGFGCILAHSMGLGKTLQVVTFSDTFLRHTSAKTILCIMPINTLQNWLAEFNMWLPTEEAAKNSPLLVHGEVRPRNFNLHVLNDSHKTLAARAKVIHNWNTSGGVLLIGYEQYRLLSLKRCPKSRSKKAQQRLNDDDKNKHLFDEVHEALVQPGPDLVVCDEGHRIKNSHASISQALKLMRTKRRVVLTGYPLQNNLMEYWCMVDFVRPNYLGTKTEFCNMFERPIQNGQCIDSTENDIKLMRYRAHVLHSLLLGFVQRRSHRVLQTALPQKEEYVLLVRMTPFQRTLYETFMNEVVRSQTVPNPLKAFAVCCKIWNHPDVLYYYLKKQDKGGAVDIDLEEVTTVAPAPVNAKVAKPRVKKQGKKEKPAASVTPYNSNSSTADTNTSAITSTAPAQNADATQRANKYNTPQNNCPPVPTPNYPNAPPQTMMNNSNYPVPNYPPPAPINSYPGNGDYRANFNQSRPQFGNNQYGNTPGGYPNPGTGSNYRVGNEARMAYPTPRAHYDNGQPYSNYMQQHMHSSQQHPTQSPHPHQPATPQTHHQQPQQPHTYPNTPNTNYQYNQTHTPQAPNGPGPSNYNMMQPYNANPNYPNYQATSYQNYNQSYWNPNQQQQPYQQDIKPDAYSMPYDPNNEWVKQEDAKVKAESDSKPKINILSDICISNTYDGRASVTDKKINILSDIKLEPKVEQSDAKEEIKTENSQEEQKLDDILETKVEKTELDEEVKCLSPVKLAKEDTGIPYDWAIELLKDYVPGFIENSAKMEILFSIVKESLALGDRLLVFSQSLITLDLIEQFLQMNVVPGDVVKWAKNTSYYRLDGSTTALEREKLINEFNSNPKVHLFLVSTRAGSLGINLIGANRVVVLDASWNPCHDTQAVCRVYRYGQRKPCFVYRLVVDNCLEKKIYDRQINKQGMSDRVVDECNPDAHLTMKDVTTLCWDGEQETEEKDWSYCKDKYIDVVLQKVLDQHGKSFNKEPFQHESLLIDRKDKQLSSLEKRMAKRGYEREKQAARQPNYSVNTGIRHRPVASVRPMQQAGDARSSKWIPAEHWQRQGMTAQEMTLPLDVVIPTVQPDKGKIVLKAGQKVLILKSPKGVYMQLESGKIVSIKTAIKVRGKVDEDSNNSTTPPSQPSPSPPPNLPLAIKHTPAITVTTTPPKRAVKPFVSTPKLNIRARAPISPRLPPRPIKKVQMIRNVPVVDEQAISSGDEERIEDKRVVPPLPKPTLLRHDLPRARDISMRDVRPVRHQFHAKRSPAKGTSALQQLEKSTTAIISESKQPFQETLNSITKSYQDEETTKSAPAHPITIDDESEEKVAQRVTQQQPQTALKPSIPPNPEYGGQYGSYGNYGYNMPSFSTPAPQQQYAYSPQGAPPAYDMNAYSSQSSQSQHPQRPPQTAPQPVPAPPPPQTSQQPPQHTPHHQQQPGQSQGYNYGGYPPHMYSTSVPPPQYAAQTYDYAAPPPPPTSSQSQQHMYNAPYSYHQYPPPGGPPQAAYASAPPAPTGYPTGDYQYPTAPDPAASAPPYYPPQT